MGAAAVFRQLSWFSGKHRFYGVILVELITRLEALSPDNNVRLISKIGPVLKDVSKPAPLLVSGQAEHQLCKLYQSGRAGHSGF
nr:probable receptor-like protein kinase At1g33260 [Ipomoea batatas]